ncbi:MAG: ribosome maturation factor RimM [Candidatus Nanopelagicales bacterium]
MQVVVGRIGRPHGVKGEINVEVLTDNPEQRFQPQSKLKLQNSEKTLTVKSIKLSQKKLLVFFEEIQDRNQADEYKGQYLTLDLDESEIPTEGDEFYDQQLIGLKAFDQNQVNLGEIIDVIHGAAQDLLVIKTPENKQVLVPFVDEIVPEVNVLEKTLLITPPKGLFDDQAIEAK